MIHEVFLQMLVECCQVELNSHITTPIMIHQQLSKCREVLLSLHTLFPHGFSVCVFWGGLFFLTHFYSKPGKEQSNYINFELSHNGLSDSYGANT